MTLKIIYIKHGGYAQLLTRLFFFFCNLLVDECVCTYTTTYVRRHLEERKDKKTNIAPMCLHSFGCT